MAWFNKIFGSRKTPERFEPSAIPVLSRAEKQPSAVEAGKFVAYQVLFDKKFGLSTDIESLSVVLPESIRGHFAFWAAFYLIWRMRDIAGEKYGSDFQREMSMYAFSEMKNCGDALPNIDIPIDTTREFLKHFDFAAEWYAQATGIDKRIVTIHFPIAVELLVHSSGTPYFGAQSEVLHGADSALAMALKKLDDLAWPLLLKALELTAEGAEPGAENPSGIDGA